MNDIEKIQTDLSLKRKDLHDTTSVLQVTKAALLNLEAKATQELKGLDDSSRTERNEEYKKDRKKLVDQVTDLTNQKNTISENIKTLTAGFLKQLNPIEKISELKDAFPILLFPLRLETRFKSTNGTPQLWLRVYPDDCNINKKEELLSDSEINNATAFWVGIWKAGGLEVEERGAWRSLVNSCGSGRAAFIIDHFKPTNAKPVRPSIPDNPNELDPSVKILVVVTDLTLSTDEYTAAKNYWSAVWMAKGNFQKNEDAFAALVNEVGGDTKAKKIKENFEPVNILDELPSEIKKENILLETLTLPSIENITTTQTSWTNAPKAIALPDRFVAIRYTGATSSPILFEKNVKDQLAVGPDPSLDKANQIKKDEQGNLILNEELQWMVDFEKAIDAGMALKIDLAPQEAINGFDKLFVVGIRLSSSETDGKDQLEKLISDHFYGKDGFGLVKQGTPSNNTDDDQSGYSWIDNPDESFDRFFKKTESFTNKDDLSEKSDGQKLADYLGIDADVLKNVPNANGTDQSEANAMNTALFPATLGYFMEEMMQPIFAENDIDATKDFFTNYVSGRGPVPTIRIGKQPYGILPVTVYSKINIPGNSNIKLNALHKDGKPTFYDRLKALIMKMDEAWDDLLPGVAYIGKEGDPHQILLDVLGLHANSVEFYQRYSQSFDQLHSVRVLQTAGERALSQKGRLAQNPLKGASTEAIAHARAVKATAILKDLGADIANIHLPILEKYFLSLPNLLEGPIVNEVISETSPLPKIEAIQKNYIEWLTTAGANDIRIENFSGTTPPIALLYLLLRHALMLAQSDAAAQLLVSNKIAESKKTFFDPSFIHVAKNGSGKSKFEHLYGSNMLITGDSTTKLAEHIYKEPIIREAVETTRLRTTIDALKKLANTETAKLERLFVEHIDCCSYRIDAWKTGLANLQLTKQRSSGSKNNFTKGIYLGAYGWLLDVRPANKVLTDVSLPETLSRVFSNASSPDLQTDNTNLGYIHAPSLNQAATAAILRNAYDSNPQSATGNPFAINLTSGRVRIAESFLEGIRNGQSLSALLGYQFERSLHDKYSLGQGEADVFIYPLRKAFPLVADKLKDTESSKTDAIETIEANNVIDGLKFINHIKTASIKNYPFGISTEYGLIQRTDVNGKTIDAINKEAERLLDIHDAISDLVIAEQVYQVVQGNFERASGNADAFSKGTYPPDIDIVNTPRSGVVLTHRVSIQFNGEASETTAPNSILMTPRASAEPSINEWLAGILPDPGNVCCKVTYKNPAKEEIQILVTQEDLGLQAIDLLYCLNLDAEQAMTELDDRIMNYCRYELHNKTGFTDCIHPKTDITINYTEVIDPADKTKISFFELAALLKSLRKITFSSKPLSPEMLTVPVDGKRIEMPVNSALMTSRINKLKSNLNILKNEIDLIITSSRSLFSSVNELKELIKPHITDPGKVDSVLTQLRIDYKSYLSDSSNINKTAITDAFINSVNTIPDATIINNIKNEYIAILDSLITDYLTFDAVVKKTCSAFLKTALYNNNETGTGFIQQGISGIYDSIFSKVHTMTERWKKKSKDYDLVYNNLTGTEQEKITQLQKAERIISTGSTFPVPTSVVNYLAILDPKKTAFGAILIELSALLKNTRRTITAFISDIDAVLLKVSDHDLISFDTDRNCNDSSKEKWMIALIKEDMAIALSNLSLTIAKRIAACTELLDKADSTIINSEKIAAIQQASKYLLGEEALLLPQFKLEGEYANEFENAYRASSGLLDFVKANEERILPVEDWLAGIARVREKMYHLENASVLSGAFISDVTMDLKPLQFPYYENDEIKKDRWLAMKFRNQNDPNDKFSIDNDQLLYTTHFASQFDKLKPQCGIVVDEWTEVIPAKEETTGIAFHYDQPNSEPPQTMLLVVPSQITGNWQWSDIVESLEETLEMAKKRAVEPSQVDTTGYAQFLPSTMMAVTLHAITVATNLAVNNNIHDQIPNN
jgi:hypothetical protein